MSGTTARRYRLVFLTVNSSYSHSSLALPLLHAACRDLVAWEWFRCDTTVAGKCVDCVYYGRAFQLFDYGVFATAAAYDQNIHVSILVIFGVVCRLFLRLQVE